MKKFFKEFKEFALRGNVISLAVGVIIGAAFQGVVTSLTDNIISPIIGLFAGQNFDSLSIDLFGATLFYGAFITSLINFIIMAFVLFLMVRTMNRIMSVGAAPEPEKPPSRKCLYCMSEIHTDATRCPACTAELKE